MWRISEFSSLAIVKSCAVSLLWFFSMIGSAHGQQKTQQRVYWNFYHLIVYVPRWQVSIFSWMALFPRCLGRSLYLFVFGVFESWSTSHKILALSFWKFMFMFWSLILKTWGRWHAILRRVIIFFSNAWFKHYLEMPKNCVDARKSRNLWCRPKKL